MVGVLLLFVGEQLRLLQLMLVVFVVVSSVVVVLSGSCCSRCHCRCWHSSLSTSLLCLFVATVFVVVGGAASC